MTYEGQFRFQREPVNPRYLKREVHLGGLTGVKI
jgi:hypothetical protein